MRGKLVSKIKSNFSVLGTRQQAQGKSVKIFLKITDILFSKAHRRKPLPESLSTILNFELSAFRPEYSSNRYLPLQKKHSLTCACYLFLKRIKTIYLVL
jgi:hypothetical protein